MKQNIRSSKNRGFAIASILLGAVGWFASFELATEYIKKLKSPDYVPNCDFSILVTCGPNMDSAQGSVLGFSNTLIGLFAFFAPIFVGFALLAGAKFAKWFWWVYISGLALGFYFVFWLATQSVFVLGTLCPWCMVVWTVTIPLFIVTLLRSFAKGNAGGGSGIQRLANALYSWSWVLILACYLLIALLAQIGVDWIGFMLGSF